MTNSSREIGKVQFLIGVKTEDSQSFSENTHVCPTLFYCKYEKPFILIAKMPGKFL